MGSTEFLRTDEAVRRSPDQFGGKSAAAGHRTGGHIWPSLASRHSMPMHSAWHHTGRCPCISGVKRSAPSTGPAAFRCLRDYSGLQGGQRRCEVRDGGRVSLLCTKLRQSWAGSFDMMCGLPPAD